jgi:hypothetical protein
MSIGDAAADFGKGLFAGAAGTAAMTVSSNLEMKLSGRAAGDLTAARMTPAFRARTTRGRHNRADRRTASTNLC